MVLTRPSFAPTRSQAQPARPATSVAFALDRATTNLVSLACASLA